jgi:hypothetical protein
MRERINIAEALRLYQVWRNWREVAARLSRNSLTPFKTQSVIAAVRRHDRGLA